LKITDFFSYEELLEVEKAENFVYLSAEYSELYELGLVQKLSRDEEVRAIRSLVKLLSAIFSFPVILACDCYVKMLDIYDYYEEDRIGVMKDLAQALDEHIKEADNTLMITDRQSPGIDDNLDKFRARLEKSWKKDLN